jgi:hypothetical protein
MTLSALIDVQSFRDESLPVMRDGNPTGSDGVQAGESDHRCCLELSSASVEARFTIVTRRFVGATCFTPAGEKLSVESHDQSGLLVDGISARARHLLRCSRALAESRSRSRGSQRTFPAHPKGNPTTVATTDVAGTMIRVVEWDETPPWRAHVRALREDFRIGRGIDPLSSMPMCRDAQNN